MNLKPCPFCGAQVRLLKDHTPSGVDQIIHIYGNGVAPLCGIEAFSNFASDLPANELWNMRDNRQATDNPPDQTPAAPGNSTPLLRE